MRKRGASDPDPERARDPQAARSAGVKLLARRDYASGELRAKLEGQGYAPEAVASALAELTETRALDDARYAANFVSYHASRGQGPVRIARELRECGIPAGLIDETLAAGPDFLALARELRGRRFGPVAPHTWVEKARQARFLQYRGFSSDHIRAALGADFDRDDEA